MALPHKFLVAQAHLIMALHFQDLIPRLAVGLGTLPLLYVVLAVAPLIRALVAVVICTLSLLETRTAARAHLDLDECPACRLFRNYLIVLGSAMAFLAWRCSRSLLVSLVGIAFASDAGAYFVGRALGNIPLVPSISPTKTVEGALGGLTAAWLFAHFLAPLYFEFWLVLVLGVSAQLGDLIESAWKRHVQVSESGTLFRAHGGVLDRFDSVFGVALVAFLLLRDSNA